MARWQKRQKKLSKDHGWSARPGCKIFVADRGAVRFDFPQSWVVIPDSDSIKLHDKPPPDDNCVVAVSYIRLPPIDWSGLPLRELVETATQGDERPIHTRGPIHETRRADLEIAWQEMGFVDPQCQREAISRLCIARWGRVQALITSEFWADEAAKWSKVWELVLDTLQLDTPVEDPTRGPKPQA